MPPKSNRFAPLVFASMMQRHRSAYAAYADRPSAFVAAVW